MAGAWAVRLRCCRSGLLTCVTLAVSLGQALASSTVGAATVGDSSLVSARVEFERIPHCEFTVTSEVCLLGYDGGGTPSKAGDDTVYLYQSLKKITVHADPDVLDPEEFPKHVPRKVSLDTSFAVEHPVFILVNETGHTVNESRPGPANQFLLVRQTQNGTIFVVIVPLQWLTGNRNLPPYFAAGVPILYNIIVANYTHITPMDDDVIQPESTDIHIDGPLNQSLVENTCDDPFYVPVERTVPGTCPIASSAVGETNLLLKDNLPGVVCCADTRGAEIRFGGGGTPGGPVSGGSSILGAAVPLKGSPSTLAAPLETETSRLTEEPTLNSEPSERLASTLADTSSPPSARPAVSTPRFDLVLVAVGVLVLALLALYSRISRDRVLENHNRNRIYDTVRANPGLTVGETSRMLQLDYKTVERHMRRLGAAGFVSSHRRAHQRFFENHSVVGVRTRALIANLRTPAGRAILKRLLLQPSATQTDLAACLNVPISTVNFYVLRLEGLGALVRERKGPAWAVSLDTLWRAAAKECLESSLPTAPASLGNSS